MPEICLGELPQVKLFEVLKPLLSGDKTGKISIKGKEAGELFIEAGNIVYAKTGHATGEYAFFTIMGWKVGKISFEPDELPKEKTIQIPTEQLLFNWSSQKQEIERIKWKDAA